MTESASFTTGRVVLWEDDPVRRPLLAAILEAAGIPTTCPDDSQTAMELATAPGATALVLDANVARPSGAEFLRELRHRRRGHPPPIVALLQPGQACLRLAMRELGVERLISEPFEPARLVEAVLGTQGRLGAAE